MYYIYLKIVIFIFFLFLINTSCSLQHSSYVEDWPIYQFDYGHRGYVSTGPEPPLKEKWIFQTQGRIVDPPVLAGTQLAFGSRDGWLYLLNSNTGQLIWKEEIGQGGLSSSPQFSSKHIFGGKWTPYYYVYAWDRETGRRIWEYQTGEMINQAPMILSTEKLLFFNIDPPLSAPTDILSVIRAVSIPEFKLFWEQPLKGVFAGLPAFSQKYNLLFIALQKPPALVALDTQKGTVNWYQELNDKPITTPLWSKERVYIGTETGYLYSFFANGRLDWNYKLQNERIMQDLALTDRQLLITGEKYLYAFDLRDLQVKWRFRATSPLTAPVATEKYVYIGSENKLIYILDSLTGNIRGFNLTTGQILASPVIAGKQLFVGTSDGKLYAFEEAPRSTYIQPPRR